MCCGLVQVLRAIGGSLQGVLTFSVVTFGFVILGLLEVEPLRRRLCRLGDGTVGRDRDRHGGRDCCTTADLHAGLPAPGILPPARSQSFGARWLLLEDRPPGLEIS